MKKYTDYIYPLHYFTGLQWVQKIDVKKHDDNVPNLQLTQAPHL
jgi:hypothetical protein